MWRYRDERRRVQLPAIEPLLDKPGDHPWAEVWICVPMNDVRDMRPPGDAGPEDLARHRGVRVQEVELARDFSGGTDPARSPEGLQVHVVHLSSYRPEVVGSGALIRYEQPDSVPIGRQPTSYPERDALTTADGRVEEGEEDSHVRVASRQTATYSVAVPTKGSMTKSARLASSTGAVFSTEREMRFTSGRSSLDRRTPRTSKRWAVRCAGVWRRC